jgi:hypothetical protein
MTVRCKHTKLTFDVKRVRNSGKVELMNGVVIPVTEFNMNWEVVAAKTLRFGRRTYGTKLF